MPLSPNFRSDAQLPSCDRPDGVQKRGIAHGTTFSGLGVCKNAELHTERRFRVLGCVKTRNRTPCALASSGSCPERLKNAAQSELPFGCICSRNGVM